MIVLHMYGRELEGLKVRCI